MVRPKVVVFTPVYPPRRGGASTYFSTLSDLLKDQVEITIVCMEDPDLPSREKKDGVDILRALPDEFGSSPLKRYVKVVPRALSALRRLRKEGDFVLHAHSNGIYGFSASLFSVLYGVPMIKEVQDTSDPGWNLKFGKVRRWVACGGYVRKRLEGFGIPKDMIRTFPIINPPVVDREADRYSGHVRRPDDVVRFVFVGWLMNRIKGVDVLIEAFNRASVGRSDLELVIIGDGPDRNSLEMMAEGHPIRFMGELSPEEVREWLLRSHAVVMASHEEAAGRSYIEGYAAGIPSIGTRVGGTPEVVIDGRTGLLVPPSDPEGLSEAMLRLAGDPDLRERLGRGGREFLKELPDWDEVTAWYLNEYRSLYRDG